MYNRILIIILGMISCNQLFSQECYIKIYGLDTDLLKINRIKEIKIFRGEENSKKLFHEYTINKSGCAEKHSYYDQYADSLGPITETFERSRDGKMETFRGGRKFLNNKFKLIHEVRNYYSASGKLWRKTNLELVDLINYTIENLDTINPDKIDRIQYTLLEGSKDTLRVNKTFYDLKKKETYLREKKNGNWIELEKTITTFDTLGNFIDYKLYKKGKLHTEYSRKELDKKNQNEKEMDERSNPLPIAGEAIDTFYIDIDPPQLPLDRNKTSGKYKVIVTYDTPGRKAIKSYDLSHGESGLLIKRAFTDFPSSNEAYEYIFWPKEQ